MLDRPSLACKVTVLKHFRSATNPINQMIIHDHQGKVLVKTILKEIKGSFLKFDSSKSITVTDVYIPTVLPYKYFFKEQN